MFSIFETGMTEKKLILSHKNDESMTSENNYDPTTSVATKTKTLYEAGKFGACFPRICDGTQTGTDAGFCWCCVTSMFCTKNREDCQRNCKL